jgi:hypothetical protein
MKRLVVPQGLSAVFPINCLLYVTCLRLVNSAVSLPLMEDDQEYEYIPVETAADILKMSPRMVNKYGNDGRLRTKKAGRRVLYVRTDVETLADELGVDLRPPPKAPRADLVPVGEMMDYIRDRDTKNEALQHQLLQAVAEIATLRERLEHTRLLTDDNEALRKRIQELESQLDEETNKPWYKKLF